MAWNETCPMRERMKFIAAYEQGEQTMAALCRAFGISRESGYKWLARWRGEGLDGLKERSRAPHRHPNRTPPALAERVVAARLAHPHWGPKKLRVCLARDAPDERWPAASTIGDILAAAGLVVPRRSRPRLAARTQPFADCLAANDLWTIDWKGWVRTGDGQRCEPLTLCDACSRYLLRCLALGRSDGAQAWAVLEGAFREYGLPKVLRSDNGPPFASRGVGRLSHLSVQLIKAGVMPEWIDPGRPQQNGRHERLHLTLQQETMQPPAASRRAQNHRFAAFRHCYNEERPHEALGQVTPASCYQPSPRSYSGRLRAPEYGDDQEVRRVRSNGQIKWRGKLVFVGEALVGEPVGLAQRADGWQVSYGPILLGLLRPGTSKLSPVPAGRRDRPGEVVEIAGAIPTPAPAQPPQQPV